MTLRQIWQVPGENLVLEELTDRELQVLRYVAGGSRNREIAHELRVTTKTIEFHLSNIFGKLGVRSRTEAVVRAWQSGMLEFTPFLIDHRSTGGRQHATRLP